MKHLLIVIILLLVAFPVLAQTKPDSNGKNDELILKIEDHCDFNNGELCIITVEEFVKALPNVYKGVKFHEDIKITSFKSKNGFKLINSLSADGINYSPPGFDVKEYYKTNENLTENEIQEVEAKYIIDPNFLPSHYQKNFYEGLEIKGFIKDKQFKVYLKTYWYELYGC